MNGETLHSLERLQIIGPQPFTLNQLVPAVDSLPVFLVPAPDALGLHGLLNSLAGGPSHINAVSRGFFENFWMNIQSGSFKGCPVFRNTLPPALKGGFNRGMGRCPEASGCPGDKTVKGCRRNPCRFCQASDRLVGLSDRAA